MGYSFNNNQPFVFDYNNGFCGTVQREYCLLKNSTDRLSAQLRLAASTTNISKDPTFTLGSELMSNPEFTGSATGWTLTGGWGYNSNNIATITGGTVSQAVTGIQIGKTYYVEFEFYRNAYGASPSLTFSLGGDISSDLGAINTTGGVYGIAKGYFIATNTNGVEIINNNDWRGYITRVTVKESGWAEVIFGNFITTNTTNDDPMNWEIGTGACHTQGNAVGLFIETTSYSYALTIGSTYKIVVTASNITEGEVNVYLGNTLIGTIETNGSYIFTGTNTTGLLDGLCFVPTTSFDGCLDNVYLYSIADEFQAAIFDTDDNFIMAIPSSEITQDGEYVYIDTTPAELNLTDGCYRIKLTETSLTDVRTEYITNGDFTSGDTNWTHTSGWTFDNVNADAASADSTDIETMTQSFTIETCDLNRTLTLTFDLTIDTDSELEVTVQGVNSGTPFGSETFGSNGSKTITVTPTDDTDVEVNFNFVCVAPAVNKTCSVDNVSMFSSGCDLTYPYESNCFNVAESHDCTKNFEWYNNKNSFGFNYVDFTVRFDIRIHCDFGKWKHSQTVNIWENYNLANNIVAGTSKEEFEVKTEMLPENVHRCLAIARLHEYLYIDTVRTYAVPGDYEPEWNEKNKNFAIVRFDVWQQGLRTNACGQDILTPADEELLLDPTTEDCIISLE